MISYTYIDTPIGELLAAISSEGVVRIGFVRNGQRDVPRDEWTHSATRLRDVATQIREYFDGERTEFDLRLDARGTEFQRRVWAALRTIPYGETRTYGEISRVIGQPAASRAVGLANGANPIPIIVPCHRVIGSSGALTGFGGGLEVKRFLLELEGQRTMPLLVSS